MSHATNEKVEEKALGVRQGHSVWSIESDAVRSQELGHSSNRLLGTNFYPCTLLSTWSPTILVKAFDFQCQHDIILRFYYRKGGRALLPSMLPVVLILLQINCMFIPGSIHTLCFYLSTNFILNRITAVLHGNHTPV